ncbi:SelT/SelW/SelH family protein [Desertihabitans brevis]|uniref:SelT/SelW/SelH family protein n=1 Tax=Desertihabitans brevis TaxID=2268447 RepID=A0A367YZY0_9ACTN|nr:SelT/SelW/SelH family protein [Desertihabitans brevis]RCK71430.1 SelT/SelW/SelH family protein [Desertihabitans brevis]
MTSSGPVPADAPDAPGPGTRASVRITYCTQCQWLLRASWLAGELLTSFGTDLEVTLSPGTGGVFEVRVGDTVVWERRRDGGFPEAKELKRRVRDVVDPGRDLGHTDR